MSISWYDMTMQSVKLLLKRHWGGVFASILVGFIVIAPQLVFITSLGSAYKGLYLTQTDAEPHYLARMEEAVKGDGIGNPFVIEGRDSVPSGFYSFSETLLSAPASLLGVSAPNLNLFYKFLLPALLALLLYAFVIRLEKSRGWALVCAAAVVLGSTAFNFGTISAILHGSLQYQQFLLFARPVSPVLYILFLVSYLHVLVSYLRHKKFLLFLILALLFGLSWYLYIYLATFLLSILGGYVLWYLVRREWKNALWLGGTALLGLIVAVPALLSLRAITLSPFYQYFVGPIGLQVTHMPYVHIPLLVVTALCLGYWYKRKSFTHAREAFALLLSAFVVMNQQVITGLSLHPGHYVTYFCIPIYIIVLSLLAADYFKNKKEKWTIVLQGAVIAYVVIAAAFIQYSSYVYWSPIGASEQRNMVVIQLLTNNTPPESVVMANHRLSELIPAFTKDNVMWETHANSYLMPEARWHFTPENAITTPDFCAFVSVYQLNYVVWDTVTDPSWNSLDTKKCLRLVAQQEGFKIYSVI